MTIQNLKSDLNTNYRTVSNSDYQNYTRNLINFLNYIDDVDILRNITEEMKLKYSELNEISMEYVNQDESFHTCNTIEETAILSWLILKNLLIHKRQNLEDCIQQISRKNFGCHEALFEAMYSHFSRNVVEPVYNYLLSTLNNTNLTLNFLIKYKHRSEWFKKDNLYKLFKADTSKGEANLNYDLYEYLFDQGIDFHIEPRSESGRPDLIESQKGNNRLIADGKIFDTERSKGKSYIINGFNQVYTYTKTYNNSLGYLIIFKTCEKELVLNFSKEQEIPYFTHNGRTVFFLIIDIYQYETTASKRGKLEVIEINESELVTRINE
ncbi:MAG: hypothetical protein ABIY50_12355 [Ignavibacteria bacterium]